MTTYSPEMIEIVQVLNKVSADPATSDDILKAMMALSPMAKMVLSDMLDGFIAYEPEVWRACRLSQ